MAVDIEMMEVNNPALLRDMLALSKLKSHAPRAARFIRAELLTRIYQSRGSDEKIRQAVEMTFSEISANGLASDANLVADALKAWLVAYPHCGEVVIDTLLTDANSSISSAGEGVVVGLLEMLEIEPVSLGFEDKVFEVLFKGPILSAVDQSLVTKEGSGRLANTLPKFVSKIWNPNVPESRRLPKVVLLLRRLKQFVESPGAGAVIFRDLSFEESTMFIHHFTNALVTRLFLSASVELKLFVVNQWLDHSPVSPLAKWQALHPELVST